MSKLIDWLLSLFGRWYIVHTEVKDEFAHGIVEGEKSYFGPFKKKELQERLNDAYGDFLASDADELEAVRLSRKQVKEIKESEYIPPRAYWMEQVTEHEEYL